MRINVTIQYNLICNLRVMRLTLHANNFNPKPVFYIQMQNVKCKRLVRIQS